MSSNFPGANTKSKQTPSFINVTSKVASHLCNSKINPSIKHATCDSGTSATHVK